MDRPERFYKIAPLLNDRWAASMDMLIDEMVISWATVKGDIAYMRDRQNTS